MLPPNTASAEDREAARKVLKKIVRRGGLIVPPGSPFAQTVVEVLDMFRHDGTVTGCEHVAARPDTGDLGHVVIATWVTGGPLWCGDCYAASPPLTHCQVCLRMPSPGLRTVVARHPGDGVLIIGRLCKTCRPGRVA